jgi:hypothetical protein
MTAADPSRRNALQGAATLLLLPSLAGCALSAAGETAQLIADALDATWRFIVAQVPALSITPATQASLTNAFRAIHAGAWELTTQAAASPEAVVDYVKGVNEVLNVIVATPAIPLDLPGPSGDPISAILAAVVTLMPEVESSFKLAIPVAAIERPAPGAPSPRPPVGKVPPPMSADAAQALLARVAATRKQTTRPR